MGDILASTLIRSRLTVRELIQLTDLDAEGEVNDTALAAQITGAEADVKPYVVRRGRDWDALIASPPAKLVEILYKWWRWKVYSDRQSVAEDMQKQHDEDRQWLEDYAQGKGTLGDDDDPQQLGATGKYDANTRVFDRDDLEGF